MAARKQAKKAARKRTQKNARKRPRRLRGKKGLILGFLATPFRLIEKIARKGPSRLRWPIRLGLGSAFLAGVFGLFICCLYYLIACTYDLDRVQKMPARSEILDSSGQILKNSSGQEIGFLHGKNRQIVRYDEVPTHFIDALIAQEDKRFRNHGAIDFRSMARVGMRALTRGKLEGGGTLSMQLARNSFSLKRLPEGLARGIHRKILEIFIAVRIESRFEKNEILEHYMNLIFWGGSVRGVEVAAQTYFNCSASELTLPQSALLVGIIRAPNRFSPIRHPKRAIAQRDWVLKKMVENEAITQEEADAAKKAPLNISTSQSRAGEGSYALDSVRRDLLRILEDENIRDGGLIIQTTIDQNIQKLAEKSLKTRLRQFEQKPGFRHQKQAQWNGQGDPNYLQGAAVVIDNDTGAVRAIVGGRYAEESQFNRATQAQRPIGSLFKPFIFLAAFDRGVRPNDIISDDRLKSGEISGGEPNWNPHNSDERYFAEVQVSQALIQSRNTSSIRVANTAGMDGVLTVARAAGFDTDQIPRVPSSYLGSWGASPETVASAYTIFPNGGTRFRPYFIDSIKNRDGEVLWQNGPIPYRATSAAPAWEVSRVLEEVNRSGTARALTSRYGFRKPSGGKTGTTNGPTDAWYAGYTSALTCAVWVGMDRNEVILNNASGASLALPIWADIMKGADRLSGIKNGPISPGRALLVSPINEEIPQAEPIGQSPIPRAIPVNPRSRGTQRIPRAIPVN